MGFEQVTSCISLNDYMPCSANLVTSLSLSVKQKRDCLYKRAVFLDAIRPIPSSAYTMHAGYIHDSHPVWALNRQLNLLEEDHYHAILCSVCALLVRLCKMSTCTNVKTEH